VLVGGGVAVWCVLVGGGGGGVVCVGWVWGWRCGVCWLGVGVAGITRAKPSNCTSYL
jgi:hypothetical protein